MHGEKSVFALGSSISFTDKIFRTYRHSERFPYYTMLSSYPQVIYEYKRAVLHVGTTNKQYYCGKSRSKSAVAKTSGTNDKLADKKHKKLLKRMFG